MQRCLCLVVFEPKKGNPLLIELVQSVLDEQPLLNSSVLNSTHVFLFMAPQNMRTYFTFSQPLILMIKHKQINVYEL